MIRDRADVQRAVNQLIAAAIAHTDAIESGQGPSYQQRLVDAVAAYCQVRSEGDAARDDFLAKYPTPGDLSAALVELQVNGRRHYGLLGDDPRQTPAQFPGESAPGPDPNWVPAWQPPDDDPPISVQPGCH